MQSGMREKCSITARRAKKVSTRCARSVNQGNAKNTGTLTVPVDT